MKYNYNYLKEVSEKYTELSYFFNYDTECYLWIMYMEYDELFSSHTRHFTISNKEFFEEILYKLKTFDNESIVMLKNFMDKIKKTTYYGDYDDIKQTFIDVLNTCNKEIRIRKLNTIL